MDTQAPEPTAALPTISSYAIRHDGWTGEKMAVFCETLAETAVVAEACDAARMGISGAYAARRRNPVFAAAWDAALSIARERLADTLLARSMEGNIEQIYKDGELVGERHVLDNRLGLAILRRLDRLAETGLSVSTRGERFSFPGEGRGTAPIDWAFAIDALRTGDDAGVAKALALLEGDKVEEVEEPPVSLSQGDNEGDEGPDFSDRCWKDEIEEVWLTDFPPPKDFTGYESRPYDDVWDDEPYKRACTEEEAAILEADRAALRAYERAHDEALRDAWFAYLKEEPEEEEEEEEDEVTDRHPGPFDAASGVAQDMLEPG